MTNRNWTYINNRLVRQGTLLIDLSFLCNWKKQLVEMNACKEGARFEYPNALIHYAGAVRCMLKLPFRQAEGLLIGIAEHAPELPAVPDYSTLCRRFNTIDAKLLPHPKKKGNEEFWIAIDASGICVTNRDEWMRKIHRKGRIEKCKGFLKIHIAVDVKKGEIVAMEITRENIGDNRMFDALLFGAINNTGSAVDRLFGDGAYDAYENFELCHELGIEPVIPVDENSSTAPPPDTFIQRRRGEPVRRRHVREQLKDRKKWKKEKCYGLRWMAETAFAVFKCRFGKYVMARKLRNMQHELLFKGAIYNQLL